MKIQMFKYCFLNAYMEVFNAKKTKWCTYILRIFKHMLILG